MTLSPSAGESWDAWGSACGFTSWSQAAEAIGITTAQLVTNRKRSPRKTIRLAMEAVLATRACAGIPRSEDAANTDLDPLKRYTHRAGHAAVPDGSDRDAYEGARVDLLDWKGRALRAEAELRNLGYTGIVPAAPKPSEGARVVDGDVRLWDTQWMSIVNHDNCYRDWSKDDAIAHAVKMTEEAIARNLADGKLPKHRTSGGEIPLVKDEDVECAFAAAVEVAPIATDKRAIRAALESFSSRFSNPNHAESPADADATADGMLNMPVATLKWWRQLVDINPQDLAPRMDAVLAAGKEA